MTGVLPTQGQQRFFAGLLKSLQNRLAPGPTCVVSDFMNFASMGKESEIMSFPQIKPITTIDTCGGWPIRLKTKQAREPVTSPTMSPLLTGWPERGGSNPGPRMVQPARSACGRLHVVRSASLYPSDCSNSARWKPPDRG